MKSTIVRILKVTGITYVVTYVCAVVFWVVIARSDSCTVGQEIEEGCRVAFPETYVFLAIIIIPFVAVMAAIYLGTSLVINLFRNHN